MSNGGCAAGDCACYTAEIAYFEAAVTYDEAAVEEANAELSSDEMALEIANEYYMEYGCGGMGATGDAATTNIREPDPAIVANLTAARAKAASLKAVRDQKKAAWDALKAPTP